MDYLSQNDLGDAITRREIRLQLKSMFLENPLIDNNFALACSLLTGGILGHPFLEDQNRQMLLSWLEGGQKLKAFLHTESRPFACPHYKIQRQAHAPVTGRGNPHGGVFRAVHCRG